MIIQFGDIHRYTHGKVHNIMENILNDLNLKMNFTIGYSDIPYIKRRIKTP